MGKIPELNGGFREKIIYFNMGFKLLGYPVPPNPPNLDHDLSMENNHGGGLGFPGLKKPPGCSLVLMLSCLSNGFFYFSKVPLQLPSCFTWRFSEVMGVPPVPL